MASSSQTPTKSLVVEVTVVAAAGFSRGVQPEYGIQFHPYLIIWLDRSNAVTTGVSKTLEPAKWNEHITLTTYGEFADAVLSIQLIHPDFRSTENIIASLEIPLAGLGQPKNPDLIRTFQLRRPGSFYANGGTIRLSITVREVTISDFWEVIPSTATGVGRQVRRSEGAQSQSIWDDDWIRLRREADRLQREKERLLREDERIRTEAERLRQEAERLHREVELPVTRVSAVSKLAKVVMLIPSLKQA